MIILGRILVQPYFVIGIRRSSSGYRGGEDTGDEEVLPCSPLWDSGVSQDGEDIAFGAALPLVQVTHI